MASTSTDLLSSALTLLRRSAIRVAAGGPSNWVLVLPDGRQRAVQVKCRRQPPTPSWIADLGRRQPDITFLIVTSHLTPQIAARAHEGTLDALALRDEQAIIAGTTYSLQRDDRPAQPNPPRGRRPWVRWATERLLLLSESPTTQLEISAVLGVSQQSISLALRAHRYARRTDNGWVVESRSEQLDDHLGEYPGPGGASTYWYGLDPAVRQTDVAIAFATELGARTLRTGDVAADIYAPWRLPFSAAAYADRIVDFTAGGFTPADESEHTLRISVPEDPTIWRTAAFATASTRRTDLADPVITMYDVLRSSGSDSLEAAERLRDAIVDGTWRG